MNYSTLKTCCAIRFTRKGQAGGYPAATPPPSRSLRCAMLASAPTQLVCLGRCAPCVLHSNGSRRLLFIPLSLLLVLTLLLPFSAHAAKNILMFGDSLSAGYGLEIDKSWGYLLQQELQRTRSGFSVVNASISGETTSGGKQRIAKALRQHKPAIVILELGANDGLSGTPIKIMVANLDYIIEKSLKSGAKVLLLGMKLPPNYGPAYTTQFADSYSRLANKHGLLLLPFLLEGVKADQFQADNLHPVAEAQQHIMLNVLQELKHLLHNHHAE